MKNVLLIHFAAFMLGALPIGYIVGRLHGIDVRASGSGNPGATNVSRVVGKKAGLLTLTGDMLKGMAAVALIYSPVFSAVPEADRLTYSATLGLGAVLGHCFSPFLRFRGGKGVATSLGVFLMLAPAETAAAAAVFALMLAAFRYVSLASLSAAAVLPVFFGVQTVTQGTSAALFVVSLIVSTVVFVRHSSNISRLRRGAEGRFSFKRAEKAA